MMHAEWAFLNQPSRLQALTDQFTKLRPIAPPQMIASAAELPMPLPSLDGEPTAPSASLVAQVDALPSFGPVPVPGRKPGEGGVLLAAAEPMPVQTQAASSQPAAAPSQPAAPAASVQVAAVEVRPAPAVAPAAPHAGSEGPQAAAAQPAPAARVAAADVPIRPVVAPRRPAAPLEAVAQALTPTRAAASDDPIGALLAGLEAPRGIR